MKLHYYVMMFVASVVFTVNTYAEGICTKTEKIRPEQFTRVYEASLKLSRHLCNMDKIDDTTLSNDAHIDQWADIVILQTLELKEVGISLSDHIQLLKQAIKDGRLLDFVAEKTGDSPANRGYTYFISGEDKSYINFDRNTNKRCKTLSYGTDCYLVLTQLGEAINVYKADINKNRYDDTYKILKAYDQSWSDYFNKARSQVLWEHLINSALYRSEITQDSFVKPPNYQVTFIHPTIALEYSDDAIDGEQYKNALAVEWLGINYWNKDNFLGYPFGISYTRIYSDRPGVDDNRSGWLLHLNNRYSIGYSDDGDFKSIFVSLDLFKLFEDKKQKLDRYRDYYSDYLKNE